MNHILHFSKTYLIPISTVQTKAWFMNKTCMLFYLKKKKTILRNTKTDLSNTMLDNFFSLSQNVILQGISLKIKFKTEIQCRKSENHLSTSSWGIIIWPNEFDRTMTMTNLNIWIWPKLKLTNLNFTSRVLL